jgi:hypothetical protein
MKTSLSSRLFLVGLLLSAIVVMVSLQRTSVAQDAPGGERARLTLPSYWSRLFGSTAILERERGGRAKLLYDLFETPLMLLPGKQPSTVICIYMFDIKNEAIVFDLGAPKGRYAPIHGEEDLRWIVQGSELPFQRVSLGELQYVRKLVHDMPEREYKRAVVSSIDLGLIKLCAPRWRTQEILDQMVQDMEHPQ